MYKSSHAIHPDMVAQHLWPAALEGHGFKALLKYIKPGYKVPTATYIAQVVHRKHEAGKRLIKEKLTADSTSLAITSDIWTSCANDAYISLTAHFITNTWQMVSCILATSPFPGHHTAVNIVDKLKEIVSSYDVSD